MSETGILNTVVSFKTLLGGSQPEIKDFA